MKSFTTSGGDRVTFDGPSDFTLSTSKDIVTNKVSGYFVEMSDGPKYEVSEEVYYALEAL